MQHPEHVDGSQVATTHCREFGSHVAPAPPLVQSLQVLALLPHASALVPSSQKRPFGVVRQQPLGQVDWSQLEICREHECVPGSQVSNPSLTQSTHAPPFEPHAFKLLPPGWQVPVPSQQPSGHEA